MPVLSIVIPAYNERPTVKELLRRVAAAPLPEGLEREVVVVDDGSTDGTREHLRELAAAGEPIPFRLVEQPENRGKGAAIRAGFAAAAGDYRADPGRRSRVRPARLPQAACSRSSTTRPTSSTARASSAARTGCCSTGTTLGNRFLTMLSNMFTDLNLTDMETCYKVFRREVLEGIDLRSDRFGIEPELTAKVARRGARIYEVPISYHGRTYAEGKKIGWKDGFAAIWTILRYNLLR